jgi:hypothetical protein
MTDRTLAKHFYDRCVRLNEQRYDEKDPAKRLEILKQIRVNVSFYASAGGKITREFLIRFGYKEEDIDSDLFML